METAHDADARRRGETLRRRQMASGMAHHVNNLLAVISGRTQLLLHRITQPEIAGARGHPARPFDAADVVRRCSASPPCSRWPSRARWISTTVLREVWS